MILLSVIIPAYNVAPWLTDCIYSISRARRPYDDALELVVVNDGSTDETHDVLQRIVLEMAARQEGRLPMQVIEQENSGLSEARNRGLRLAKGRYIAFVDGDDEWVHDISLPWEEMQAGDVEILGLDMLLQDASGHTTPYHRYAPVYDRIHAPAKEFMRGRNLFSSACSYIMKRELLTRAGLSFTPRIYHEDEDFTPRLFLAARSFKAVKGPHYIYKVRENSITTHADKDKQRKRIDDMLWIVSHLQDIHDEALRCKILFLIIDTLRVQLSFKAERHELEATLHRLTELRLYPFPFYPNLHYLLLCLYLRIRVWSMA